MTQVSNPLQTPECSLLSLNSSSLNTSHKSYLQKSSNTIQKISHTSLLLYFSKSYDISQHFTYLKPKSPKQLNEIIESTLSESVKYLSEMWANTEFLYLEVIYYHEILRRSLDPTSSEQTIAFKELQDIQTSRWFELYHVEIKKILNILDTKNL